MIKRVFIVMSLIALGFVFLQLTMGQILTVLMLLMPVIVFLMRKPKQEK